VAQIVDVVGGDRLEVDLAGDQGELGQQLALLVEPRVLQLDVDVVTTEELDEALDLGQRRDFVALMPPRPIKARIRGRRPSSRWGC